jgi:hypothetical protein
MLVERVVRLAYPTAAGGLRYWLESRPNEGGRYVVVRRGPEHGVPFAYLTFEGEQHGFRQAKNIKRAAEAELAFYGRVLGFRPADDIEPIEIHNADSLQAAR